MPGCPGDTDPRSIVMSTVTLTAETFDATVSQAGIVLVDWWASWCGPCRMFAPVFEAAAEEHPDIVFGKVDTEAEQSLARAAGIMSIPTLMVVRDGILVYSQPGALPASALADLIHQARALDMDEVRAAADTAPASR
jgi:thioredoxin 1